MRARLFLLLSILTAFAVFASPPAFSQGAAMLKAQQTQAESQKQTEDKRAALEAAGLKPAVAT